MNLFNTCMSEPAHCTSDGYTNHKGQAPHLTQSPCSSAPDTVVRAIVNTQCCQCLCGRAAWVSTKFAGCQVLLSDMAIKSCLVAPAPVLLVDHIDLPQPRPTCIYLYPHHWDFCPVVGFLVDSNRNHSGTTYSTTDRSTSASSPFCNRNFLRRVLAQVTKCSCMRLSRFVLAVTPNFEVFYRLANNVVMVGIRFCFLDTNLDWSLWCIGQQI